MPGETQLDRIERLLERTQADVSDIKTRTYHQERMMETTRNDIETLYDRANDTDKDVTALKTKSSLFGTFGGVISGGIVSYLVSLIKGH